MVVGEQKTEKEVRAEFELAFAKAGFKVSAQEFEDYFSNLSSTTSLDCDYFVFMIESVFGVKEDSLTLQTDTKYISNVMRVLKEKIRQKCKVEGKDKNTLRKHFQHFDSNEVSPCR